MMTDKALACALMALTLASCAPPTRWHSPDATAVQAERVLAECRRYASARVADDIDRRSSYVDPTIGKPTLSTQMAVHDARNAESRVVAECMTSRGFRPGTPGGEGGK